MFIRECVFNRLVERVNGSYESIEYVCNHSLWVGEDSVEHLTILPALDGSLIYAEWLDGYEEWVVSYHSKGEQ